jgi:hypothetical protein
MYVRLLTVAGEPRSAAAKRSVAAYVSFAGTVVAEISEEPLVDVECGIAAQPVWVFFVPANERDRTLPETIG